MKLTTMILITALAPSAFACPDLAGRYYCEGSYLNIAQAKNSSGATQFIINGSKYVADGKKRVSGGITFKAKCSGKKLTVKASLGWDSSTDKYVAVGDGTLLFSYQPERFTTRKLKCVPY
jgi:hypothetical protein